jgi:hypothetical protein
VKHPKYRIGRDSTQWLLARLKGKGEGASGPQYEYIGYYLDFGGLLQGLHRHLSKDRTKASADLAGTVERAVEAYRGTISKVAEIAEKYRHLKAGESAVLEPENTDGLA